MPIFIKFDGIVGDSTDASHLGWFEVDNFDFGVTTPTSGTGGIIGRSQFTPLAISLQSVKGLAALLGSELNHHVFPSVEMVETTGGENPQTIFDVKLTNVTLSELISAPGSSAPQELLALNYNKISVTYQQQNPDGSPGATQTFVSDRSSSGPAIPPLVHGGEVTPVPLPSHVQYFLKVDGVTGDLRDASHVGWFEVDGFDFGATTPTNGGAAVGRSQISPLAVDIHSTRGLATLLGDEVNNKLIKSVELVGVEGGGDGGQQTVYDLKLTNVTLGSLYNEPGAGGVEADLSFNFQKGSLMQGGTTQSFGSNRASAVATIPQDTGVTQVPATSGVHYFLKINGVTGDSRDAAHPGWFTVDGFDFGLNTPTNGGAVIGRSRISPLSVDISSVTGLAALLGDEVNHKVIKSVELVGVTGSFETGQQTLYDLNLTNVTLDAFHNAPGALGVEADLAFDFQKGSLAQAGTTQTFGSSNGAAVPDVPSTEVTAVPATSGVHYFLKVDGATGDSRDAAHVGWFNVDGFDFGITTPTSFGQAIGRSHISPLAVDVNSVSGLATLLGDDVNHKLIKSVELIGVAGGGEAQHTVYDLKLSNVTLDSVHNEPSPQGSVAADLAFDFQKGSLTQGSTTQTFGASNAEPAALAHDTGVTQAPATGLHYFLKVDGVTGDLRDAAHPGWFTVDGFDFGITTPTSAGTGGVIGRSHIAPLSVDLHSATGLAALFNDEVTNHLIKSVELVGVGGGEKGQQTIYDLKLANAALDSFHNAPGAQGVEAELAFNFQKGTLAQGETTTAFGASGGADAAATAAVPSEATQVPASSSVHYFLKVAGVTGNSRDAAHVGWFNVDGFDFGVTTPTSFGTGLPTGRAHFSPLSVDLNSLTGITALLTDEVNHRLIKSAELVGVGGAPGQQQTVYDLKLSNVQVTAVHTDPGVQGGVDTDVVLNFGKATLADLSLTPTTTTTTAAVHHDLVHDHGFLL